METESDDGKVSRNSNRILKNKKDKKDCKKNTQYTYTFLHGDRKLAEHTV